MKAPGPRLESEIVGAILLACNRLPGVRLFRLNSRVIQMPGQGGRTRLVRFGWLGAPDIIGWRIERPKYDDYFILDHGLRMDSSRRIARFVAIECKRNPRLKPTPEQQSFLDLVKRDGGIAGVVTSVEEAVALLS